MKKIAFLFLVYDQIEHEELWRRFFAGIDPGRYSIYIHYKERKALAYFERHRLSRCIDTLYADISLVHAHKLLLREAMADPDNYKFVYVSQACIPTKAFDQVHEFLTRDELGHFNLFPVEQCFPRCDQVLVEIDRRFLRKSSQWFILNRPQAEIILCDGQTELFASVYAPEEHYFVTVLVQRDHAHDVRFTPNLSDGATTFTCWPEMSYRFARRRLRKYPVDYDLISQDEITHLVQRAPCLFGRKFRAGALVQTREGGEVPLADFVSGLWAADPQRVARSA